VPETVSDLQTWFKSEANIGHEVKMEGQENDEEVIPSPAD